MKMTLMMIVTTTVTPSVLFAAGAQASSYASHGGHSESIAESHGNAQVEALSSATCGGKAAARIVGYGYNGGYSRGRSIASTMGGYARSTGCLDARGGGACAELDSVASSYYGQAVSNGEAVARGLGRAHAYSTALGRRGSAFSDSRAAAIGRRHGFANVVSDSVADSFGSSAVSRVRAFGEADCYGRADAAAVGVSISRQWASQVSADAESRAFNGYSRANAAHRNYGF